MALLDFLPATVEGAEAAEQRDIARAAEMEAWLVRAKARVLVIHDQYVAALGEAQRLEATIEGIRHRLQGRPLQ